MISSEVDNNDLSESKCLAIKEESQEKNPVGKEIQRKIEAIKNFKQQTDAQLKQIDELI